MIRSTLLPAGLMMFIPLSACSGLPEGMTDAMRQLSGQAGGSEQAADAMAAAREAAGMGAAPAESAEATESEAVAADPAPPASDPEVAAIQEEAEEIQAEAAQMQAEAVEMQAEAVEPDAVEEPVVEAPAENPDTPEAVVEPAPAETPVDADVAAVEPEPAPAEVPAPVAPAAGGGVELTVAELSRTSASLQGQTVTVVGSYQQVAVIPACPSGVGVVFIDPSFLDTSGNADVGLIAACTSDAFVEHIAQQPQYNRYCVTGPVQHVEDPIASAGFSSLVTCDTPEFVGPPELNIQIDLSF
jgi:hypothetical protein